MNAIGEPAAALFESVVAADGHATSLLSADEERQLARDISLARAAADRLTTDSPSRARLLELLRSRGAAARNQLIRRNLGLVYREAFRRRRETVEVADLVQEGCIGLMHAADKFDPDRNVRFSTYAVPWIRQAVERAAIAHQRVIRTPRRAAQASRQYGESPLASMATASLDAAAEIGALGIQLVDPRADPERDAINAVLIESLQAALLRCPSRERDVICRRYGLAGWTSQSHEVIAGEIGVCRERVRQIEASALRRLRLSAGLLDPSS